MGIYTIRLPDIGEGIAEAELVEWHCEVGDVVKEDDVVAVVMTDKAAVEVPSSVAGTVSWLAGEIGEMVSVGGKLIQLDVAGDGNDTERGTGDDAPALPTDTSSAAVDPKPVSEAREQSAVSIESQPEITPQRKHTEQRKQPMETNKGSRLNGSKPLAAPSVRARAKEEGIDLRNVAGSGPAGRINHQDLTDFLNNGDQAVSGNGVRAKKTGVKSIKVVGMRRKIAEKMSLSKTRIPHITIVEEVEMTELEELRVALNKKYLGDRPKLTLLPFIMRAIVEAVRDQPELNARYDDDAGVIHQHEAVNVGIATQTENGLSVAVVKHAEAASLWQNAETVSTLAEAARAGTIKREDLVDSTITVSSLGALGAIATTPIINHPEVAIVGINKMQVRPMWDGQQFQPCNMMNISCSFDHRVIDGWDAAVFVQKLKTLLETPAMLFVEA